MRPSGTRAGPGHIHRGGCTVNMSDHIVFRARGVAASTAPPPADDYRFEFWEPSYLRALPPGAPAARYAVWWIFDRGHLFSNDAYAVVLAWHRDVLAHRLALFPGWFRFPFMAPRDLQFGDLWTSPEHRGMGLATHAMRVGMRERSDGDSRVFWYLTHDTNLASIRTAERAGLERVGRATRTTRAGIRQLGSFELTPSPE